MQTNVPLDGVETSGILKEASKAVANIIGKPESVCLISSLFFAFRGGGGGLLFFCCMDKVLELGGFDLGSSEYLCVHNQTFGSDKCLCEAILVGAQAALLRLL